MTAGVSESLIRVAAWPLELVTDRNGRTCGFVMPRAGSSIEAHELYTPKSRAQNFPEEDFRFVLHVAANIVRAFGAVHQAGYVIGDVNHGQVLVGRDARVTLIDCDSIQVQSGGQLYTCDVGVPLFTPPELQGRSFRGLQRTVDHDRFGLAVLLFQLLFMGRHPYAGVPLNPGQSTEIEGAIKADRFAYGKDCRAHGVMQPPGTLPLSTFGPQVALLFEQAFAGRPVTARPDAKGWLDALKTLQAGLRPCANSFAHHYPGQLQSCPWCSIEARTGARLFGYKPKAGPAQRPLDIGALWGAVTAVSPPSAPPEPSTPKLVLPARSLSDQRRIHIRRGRKFGAVNAGIALVVILAFAHQLIFGLAAGAAAAVAIWPRARASDRRAALKTEADAKAALEESQQAWKTALAGTAFSGIRETCLRAKTALEALPAERKARLASLTSEAKQIEAFLDQFRIIPGEISGIGVGRISNLNAFGIETAWDVTAPRIEAIPGFGPATTAKLLTWRRSKESLFRFNPNHPVAAAELNAIEAEFSSRTHHFASILKSGPSQLQKAAAETARVLSVTGPLIEEQYTAWKLAQRQRIDFYDGIGSISPAVAATSSAAVLILIAWFVGQPPKGSVDTAPLQTGATTKMAAVAVPVRAAKAAGSDGPSVASNAVPGSLGGAEANDVASVRDETEGNVIADQPAGQEVQITPENTPPLSRAISNALDTGSTVSWKFGGVQGVVSVGAERIYQGRPCRSFAYTIGDTTSATAYACRWTDSGWRPEISFSTIQPSNSDATSGAP